MKVIFWAYRQWGIDVYPSVERAPRVEECIFCRTREEVIIFYGADTNWHGARLDVYLEPDETEDGMAVVYDIEPDQNDKEANIKALPRRVRNSEVGGMTIKVVEDLVRLSEENAKLSEEKASLAEKVKKLEEELAKSSRAETVNAG